MSSERIGVVTDSAADIPSSLLEKYSIRMIPNILVIGNRTYEDGIQISREEFYAGLPKMNPLPTTATPSIFSFQQVYQNLFAEGVSHIISIHAASRLSGIFDTASSAALSFGERVRVIDSQFLSMGLGFQVLEAAEAAIRGEALEEVVRRTEDARSRARVVAMLDTLDYVRRSGRVSWAKAQIGNLLRLKPFVRVSEGKVFSLGEVRTRKKGIDRLIELILREGPLQRLAILHTNAEFDAKTVLLELKPIVPTEPLIINVTSIIGTHVGPNGLGFAGLVA